MSHVLLITLVISGAYPARAEFQSPKWYDEIVPEKTHGFGTVARGSRLRHAFKIVNTTSYDIHIGGYKTKCGCTDVKIGSRDIPPGTQTTVEVTLDTAKFENYKASGITLVFDRPEAREVDLTVTCFIRGELALRPGSVDFGIVPRGTPRSQNLTLAYQGNKPDWAITRLTTISEHVTAELRQLGRDARGVTQYQLTATLGSTAPPGAFRDEISLITNDPNSPTIPVSINASIQAAVSVAPSVLNVGRLKPGQTVEKVVIVRSARPFRIVRAAGEPDNLAVLGIPEDAKPVHTLKVRFQAPSQPGPFHASLEIGTDLDGEPSSRVPMFATVVP